MDYGNAPPLILGVADFVERFPKMYHVSQAPSVDTIRRHGLLSTSAICDLLEITGRERAQLELCRRPESVILRDGFILNDQSPLSLDGLSKCLVGMTVEEWLAELNRHIFFFPTLPDVARLAGAVRARDRSRLILEYATADLLALGESNAAFASINTGYTLRRPAGRGAETFLPLSAYGRRPRPRVAEFTILMRVPAAVSFHIVDRVH